MQVAISILQQEGAAGVSATIVHPGLGKLRHTPVRPISGSAMSFSHLLKPSPVPTLTAGRPAPGMQRQGNKRERYQAPAEPTACAEVGRKAGEGGGKEEKKEKNPHP